MGRSAVVSDFTSTIHVYEPHRSTLPPVRPYVREFWRRRRFALELSRFTDKATYLESPLGRVWLVLNPLLLACIYYILVSILRGGSNEGFGAGFSTLAHILIGLFTFYFAQNCMTMGGASITAAGRLILNQSFPRALLPLSSVISAFKQFLPTLPVYATIYIIGSSVTSSDLAGLSWALLWVPVLLALVAVSGFGLALLFATLNVYFRDTSKLLSYVSRLWLYVSPILWEPDRLHGWHRMILWANPLGPVLAANHEVWIRGETPSLAVFGAAFGWAIFLMLVGSYFFMTREREFAIRL